MFRYNATKRWKKPVLISLVAILLVSGGLIMYARQWYVFSLRPLSSDATVRIIEVPSGSSPADIADLLQKEQLIRNSTAFSLYVRSTGSGSNLKAGSYELSPNMSTQEVVSVLLQGKEASSLFTIAPGLRLDQIRARLIDAGYTEADVDSALKVDNYSDIPVARTIPEGSSLEGYIYPETFRVSISSTPRDIIRQSLLQLDSIITEDLIQAFKTHNLSVYQAITLASIVEKEVPSSADREVVAQIFLSRLDQGVSLGSDATYYYAAAAFGGDPFPTLDSPYNTRIYTGLPPGPINNMSKTSLEAVAYPSDTDYLFFVTGDDGVNHYTRSDAEHQAAVKAYCKISCAPGYIPPSFQ